MKKVFTVFLALSVALSSFGFSITISYCPMKDNHTISFTGKTTCCCKKADEKGCCKSHKISLKKVESQYLTSTELSITAHPDFVVCENCTLTQNHFSAFTSQIILNQNTDPPEPHVPLNILFRSILV